VDSWEEPIFPTVRADQDMYCLLSPPLLTLTLINENSGLRISFAGRVLPGICPWKLDIPTRRTESKLDFF
jgi:hypothetical protein